MKRPWYKDRTDAGRRMALELDHLSGPSTVVLAVPNGGVAVAAPVARSLGRPLDLLVVRKILFPHTTEAGFGAVCADATTIIDDRLVSAYGLTLEVIEIQRQKALASVRLRLERYGRRAELPELAQKTVIIVDDGLATGSTMAAAVTIVRSKQPARVVVAAPTASERAALRLEPMVDELVCPHIGRGPSFAVAEAYQNWYDVDDGEVMSILAGFEVE